MVLGQIRDSKSYIIFSVIKVNKLGRNLICRNILIFSSCSSLISCNICLALYVAALNIEERWMLNEWGEVHHGNGDTRKLGIDNSGYDLRLVLLSVTLTHLSRSNTTRLRLEF